MGFYYFDPEHGRVGPYSLEDLGRLYQDGAITLETRISTEESDWMRELSNKGVLRYRVLPVIESSGSLRSVATRISSALSFGRKRPIQPPEPKSTAAPRRRSRLRQIVRIT